MTDKTHVIGIETYRDAMDCIPLHDFYDVLVVQIRDHTWDKTKCVVVVSPLRAIHILCSRNIQVVVLRDIDIESKEYSLLFRVLHYLQSCSRHNHNGNSTVVKILYIISHDLPKMFLRDLFPTIEFQSLGPSFIVNMEYLSSQHDHGIHTYSQMYAFYDWFRHHHQRYTSVCCFLPTTHACRMFMTYMKLHFPLFHCVLYGCRDDTDYPHRDIMFRGITKYCVISCDKYIPISYQFTFDIVIDFASICHSCSLEVSQASRSTMQWRTLFAKMGGHVLRLISMSTFAWFDDHSLYHCYQQEHLDWSILFLTSLDLPYEKVLGIKPIHNFYMDLHHTSKKKCKTFLQYPFSIKCHLYLDRLRQSMAYTRSEKEFITLAITVMNWFHKYHSFLVPKINTSDLQKIYGSDDELMVQLRIAMMVIREYPFLGSDFIVQPGIIDKFRNHYLHGLRLVFSRSYLDTFTNKILLSEMTHQHQQKIKYFLMTCDHIDRVPSFCSLSTTMIHYHWNTISTLDPYRGRHFQWILILDKKPTHSVGVGHVTLWSAMPDFVTIHRSSLLSHCLQKCVERKEQYRWKRTYRYQIVHYLERVLNHVLLENGS